VHALALESRARKITASTCASPALQNSTFDIAVLPGDGIGVEVIAATPP
jgi:hypothetical protein